MTEPLHPEERDKNGEKFSHHMITIPYEKNKFKTEKKRKREASNDETTDSSRVHEIVSNAGTKSFI